jgi:hypothetical protein
VSWALKDRVQSTLAAEAAIDATEFVLTTGHGARWPAVVSDAQPAPAFLVNEGAGTYEKVLVTDRDVDTLTVSRAAGGTAQVWGVGSILRLDIGADELGAMRLGSDLLPAEDWEIRSNDSVARAGVYPTDHEFRTGYPIVPVRLADGAAEGALGASAEGMISYREDLVAHRTYDGSRWHSFADDLSRRMSQWAAVRGIDWLSGGIAAMSSLTEGTGSSAVAAPVNHSHLQTAATPACIQVTTGAGTSGANARLEQTNHLGVFLSDGQQMVFRVSLKNPDQIGMFRIGFWGGEPETAVDDPIDGVWIEFLRTASSTNLFFVTAESGNENRIALGGSLSLSSLDETFLTFCLTFVDTGSVLAHFLVPGNAPLEVAESDADIPLSAAQRSGALFFQLAKTDPAAATAGLLFVDTFSLVPSPDRYPELPVV